MDPSCGLAPKSKDSWLRPVSGTGFHFGDGGSTKSSVWGAKLDVGGGGGGRRGSNAAGAVAGGGVRCVLTDVKKEAVVSTLSLSLCNEIEFFFFVFDSARFVLLNFGYLNVVEVAVSDHYSGEGESEACCFNHTGWRRWDSFVSSY